MSKSTCLRSTMAADTKVAKQLITCFFGVRVKRYTNLVTTYT
ncbi:hypothetical protein OOU_Y34scaffold00533g26 [Pyricularia oryzae Y34]|uniref:Uncharacterized protein n=2 Tax=Pyricularia oryzae TaxID=318829 RepID=A0AA97PL44_PYRO3|nr:hypothetical protein OOU_Y34scaffold00533g26 [Pyricularia oryzae Y34]